eukprot:12693144-Alexandrium_andersonii.AAC.1
MSRRTDNGARPKSNRACSSGAPNLAQKARPKSVQWIEHRGSSVTDGRSAVFDEAKSARLVQERVRSRNDNAWCA